MHAHANASKTGSGELSQILAYAGARARVTHIQTNTYQCTHQLARAHARKPTHECGRSSKLYREHPCTQACVRVCVLVCLRVSHARACMRTCVCACVCMHALSFTHARTQTHMHTHAHVYTRNDGIEQLLSCACACAYTRTQNMHRHTLANARTVVGTQTGT